MFACYTGQGMKGTPILLLVINLFITIHSAFVVALSPPIFDLELLSCNIPIDFSVDLSGGVSFHDIIPVAWSNFEHILVQKKMGDLNIS